MLCTCLLRTLRLWSSQWTWRTLSTAFTGLPCRSAPALLPMVQWAYRYETPLHIVGSQECILPVMSQRGVQQGDSQDVHDSRVEHLTLLCTYPALCIGVLHVFCSTP